MNQKSGTLLFFCLPGITLMSFINTAALLQGKSKRLEQSSALVVSLAVSLSHTNTPTPPYPHPTHTHNQVLTNIVSREYSWLISSLHLGNVSLSPFCKSNILIYLLTSNHLLYIETPFTSGIKLCARSGFEFSGHVLLGPCCGI